MNRRSEESRSAVDLTKFTATCSRALPLALGLLACSASAAPRIAALDFAVIGLDQNLGSFYAEHLSVRLEARNLRVVTQRDIATVLSLERQKQLLGCADDSSSCMAELAGALGVDAIATGQVAKVGKSFQVNLRILSSRDASALFVFSKLVKSEEDLLEALNEAGEQIVEKLAPGEDTTAVATAPPAELEAPGPRSSVRAGPWIVVGLGGAAAVVGAVLLGRAAAANAKLSGAPSADFTPAMADQLARSASVEQWIGIATLAVGVAAVAGGLAWHFLAGDDAQVSVAPAGPGVLVEVRF